MVPTQSLAFLALVLVVSVISVTNVVGSQYGFVIGQTGSLFDAPGFEKLTQFAPQFLGDSSTSFSYNIVGPITHIGAGDTAVALAINDSMLVTFGTCLGVGRNDDRWNAQCPPDIAVDFRPRKIVMITAGSYNYAALLDNGTVYTWGQYPLSTGEFWGRSNASDTLYTVGEINMTAFDVDQHPDEKITRIVSHHKHAVLLTSEGRVFSFGANTVGLGQDGLQPIWGKSELANPINLSEKPPGTKIVNIWTGYQTFLLLNDSTYMCYGLRPPNCDGNRTNSTRFGTAQHYRPPDGLNFTRFLPAFNATFAWDQHGNIWAWGSESLIPAGRDVICNFGACQPSILEDIPGGGKIIDLSAVQNVALYALTERNMLFVLHCGPIPSNPFCNGDGTWQRVDFPNIPGHAPDFSRVVAQDDAFYVTTREVPLCHPATPPSSSEGWSCTNGLWTLFPTPTLTEPQPIVIETPISVRGNLSIDTTTTITISPTGSPGSPSIITVQSCLILSPGSSITIKLTNEYLQKVKTTGKSGFKETTSLGLFEYDVSHCSAPVADNLQLKLKHPSSCKRYSVLSTKTGANGSRGTLTALFQVDSSRCNLWWVILLSCIGFVVIVLVVTIVVWRGISSAQRKSTMKKLDEATST